MSQLQGFLLGTRHHFKILKFSKSNSWFMVFNAAFNNISAISWWSVLLMDKLYHSIYNVVSSTHRHKSTTASLINVM